MKILVADDDPTGATALKSLLEVLGHDVVGPAGDGAQAVALAARERPDLAVLDIDMPVLSGLDAVERMTRQRPVPVILLTGHREDAYLERAAALPVFIYLTKPCAPDTLIPALRIARARFEEWAALRDRAGELARRIEERGTIERAKGLLMQVRGLSEDEAYRLMRVRSQTQRTPLAAIARAVIAAGGIAGAAASAQPAAAPR
jgi:response regulator NasT